MLSLVPVLIWPYFLATRMHWINYWISWLVIDWFWSHFSLSYKISCYESKPRILRESRISHQGLYSLWFYVDCAGHLQKGIILLLLSIINAGKVMVMVMSPNIIPLYSEDMYTHFLSYISPLCCQSLHSAMTLVGFSFVWVARDMQVTISDDLCSTCTRKNSLYTYSRE